MGRTAFALGLTMLLVACSVSGRDQDAERAALDSVLAAHVAAVNSRNADLLLNGMTHDVVYLAPALAPVLGGRALDSLVRPLYQQIEPHITMTRRALVIRGDIAVEWGCLGGYIKQLARGDSIPNDGKYLFVYQRIGDHGWKITNDIYNSGPCLAPGAAR